MSSDGHLLIGSIGTSDYGTVTYEFDDSTVQGNVSPAALVNLFGDDSNSSVPITAALIVRTEEAGSANDYRLQRAFDAAGIDYEFVDIDLISDRSDIDNIVQTIVENLRSDRFDESSIVLDISHSFRSLPIVFLLAAMQFEALDDDATLEKIYYSRFAGSRDYDTATVIDLTYLRTLIEWYDAFEAARRTGTFRGLHMLLDERREEFFVDTESSHPDRHSFAQFVDTFGAAQEKIDAGFPLEAGITTRQSLEKLSRLDAESFIGPEGVVLKPLRILLEGFETHQTVSCKTDYKLDEPELNRQASIVEFYTANEKYWIALECGRELFVNRLLYDEGITDWLDKDNRKSVAPASGNNTEASHNVPEVQQLWDRLSQARNLYAHAGFKQDERPSDDDVEEWLETLCNNIDNDEFWKPAT